MRYNPCDPHSIRPISHPPNYESCHLHPFRLFSCALCPALPLQPPEPGGFSLIHKAGPTSGLCGVLGVTLDIVEFFELGGLRE